MAEKELKKESKKPGFSGSAGRSRGGEVPDKVIPPTKKEVKRKPS